MGVNILVTDRKYFDPLKNGEDYLTDTGDFAVHLAGSVMDERRVVTQVDVSWDSKAEAFNKFTIDDGFGLAGNQCTRLFGSFLDDGFAIGDTFDFTGDTTASRTVTGLSSDGLILVFDGATILQVATENLQVRGTTPLTSLIYKYAIIENADSTNFKSLLDGSDQAFYIDGIGLPPSGPRDTGFVDGDPQGLVKGWVTGLLKTKFDSNPSTYVQRFIIQQDLIIIPYYREGDEANINAGINPDLLLGNNSLKLVASFQFRTSINNVNTSKTGVDDLQDGDIAGYDESFNGFQANYTLKSVAFENTATAEVSAGIIIDKKTTVTTRIERVDGIFSAADPITAHHSFLPQEAGYTKNTDEFKDVWLWEFKRQLIGSGPVAGTIITNLTAAKISDTEMEVIFDVEYSAAQQLKLSKANLFVLAINYGDPSLTTKASDKVMVKASLVTYVKNEDITGLMIKDKFDIYSHPFDIGGGGAVTNIEGWVEDGIVIDFRSHMDITNEAQITGARQRFLAFNPTTKDEFDLDSYEFDLGSSVLIQGAGTLLQKLNLETIRGFNIKEDDQFNKVLLKSDILIGDDQFYNLIIGFKVPWQSWIALPGANNIFYDVSKENDGLNKNANNYNLINGYELRTWIEFDILKGDITTTYDFSTPASDIRFYGDDGDTPDVFTGVIFRRTLSGVDIGTNIRTDAFTVFRIIWEHTAPFTGIDDFWVWHGLEPVNSPSGNPHILSSERANATDGLLIPLAGESFVTKVLGTGPLAGKLITECMIDFTQIDPNTTYKFSARIGSKSGIPPFDSCTKFLEDGSPKLLEDGITVKLLDGCTLGFFGW